MEVTDLSPEFLKFYDEAMAQNLNPDERWRRWKDTYGFVALPPLPNRDALAREMLDAAWPQYPCVIDRIRLDVRGIRPDPKAVFEQVSDLLGATDTIDCNILYYVGTLENNAFVAPGPDGSPFVCLPKEHGPEWMETTLPHEFTHIVHAHCAGLDMGWERPLAVALFAEGLAMRAGATCVPNRPVEDHVEHTPDWLTDCFAHEREIVANMTPHLRDSSSATLERFLLESSSDRDRQAYFVGWILVGKLVEDGYTLAQLAHLREEEIVELVVRELGNWGQQDA